MNFTNLHSLPQPLYRALIHDGYSAGTQHSDISVTRLIAPPKQVTLTKRYEAQLTEDASSRLYSLLGQSIHTVLERAVDSHSIAEERLYIKRDGWIVTGQTDLYEQDETLSDFKVTSVYAFLLSEKIEWEAQLNLNAALVEEAGFNVKKLQIVAILRDWQASKAKYDPDYPQAGVIVKQYRKWSIVEREKYISERIAIHKASRELSDDAIPVCSPADRWHVKDTWAIIGVGNKRATCVKENEQDARMAVIVMERNPKNAKKPKKYTVEHRKGGNRKCEDYCPVKSFCNFYRENYTENVDIATQPEIL